jgi:hypothetical protein
MGTDDGDGGRFPRFGGTPAVPFIWSQTGIAGQYFP